jgi:hypothetical protein
MDKNYEIIQDILSRAIQITITQKQDVSWEFYTGTKTLVIRIKFGTKSGLTKGYSINVEDTESLEIVQQELMNIQINDLDTNLENDFLG